jgi:hypothetical protein
VGEADDEHRLAVLENIREAFIDRAEAGNVGAARIVAAVEEVIADVERRVGSSESEARYTE